MHAIETRQLVRKFGEVVAPAVWCSGDEIDGRFPGTGGRPSRRTQVSKGPYISRLQEAQSCLKRLRSTPSQLRLPKVC